MGATVSKEMSRLPGPVHLLQRIRQNPKMFPGQPRDIVLACPGSPSGTCLDHLQKMPEVPSLTPFNAEEQRLYSELLLRDWALHPVPKGARSHRMQETHFGHLHLQSHSFGHYPKLKIIDEGGNIDRPVNWEFAFRVSSFFTMTDRYTECIIADATLICLLISWSIFPSLVRKEILKHLHLRQGLFTDLERGSYLFLVKECFLFPFEKKKGGNVEQIINSV